MGNPHSLMATILIIGAGFLPTIAGIANAQMMGPTTSMFCNAVRTGIATGPCLFVSLNGRFWLFSKAN